MSVVAGTLGHAQCYHSGYLKMAKVVNFPLSMSPQFTWFLKASQEHLRVVWKANDADCIPEYRLSEAREGSCGSLGALPCSVFPWGTRQG